MTDKKEVNEADTWHIINVYDQNSQSPDLRECLALFMLEQQMGWDAKFNPINISSNNK